MAIRSGKRELDLGSFLVAEASSLSFLNYCYYHCRHHCLRWIPPQRTRVAEYRYDMSTILKGDLCFRMNGPSLLSIRKESILRFDTHRHSEENGSPRYCCSPDQELSGVFCTYQIRMTSTVAVRSKSNIVSECDDTQAKESIPKITMSPSSTTIT